MRNFRDLKVWEKSHQLVLRTYQVTKLFPKDELYGVTSQLRRSSVSIPTNIAEGCGRSTDPDFSRFLDIAGGSACETEYLYILSRDLGYCSESDFRDLTRDVNEVKRMINVFTQKLRANT